MGEGKRKRRLRSTHPVWQSVGRVCEWLGILFFIGPGLFLIVIGCAGSFGPTHDPPIRDLVGNVFTGLGMILLVFGGMILWYFQGSRNG